MDRILEIGMEAKTIFWREYLLGVLLHGIHRSTMDGALVGAPFPSWVRWGTPCMNGL
jgi:hypothetical protein